MTHLTRILAVFTFVTSLTLAAVAGAQENRASAEVSLSSGISQMVRNILGDVEPDARAQIVDESGVPQTTLMMDTGAARVLQADTDSATRAELYSVASVEADAALLKEEKNGIVVFFERIGQMILDLFR